MKDRISGMGMPEGHDFKFRVECSLPDIQGSGEQVVFDASRPQGIKNNHRARYRRARMEEFLRKKHGQGPDYMLK